LTFNRFGFRLGSQQVLNKLPVAKTFQGGMYGSNEKSKQEKNYSKEEYHKKGVCQAHRRKEVSCKKERKEDDRKKDCSPQARSKEKDRRPQAGSKEKDGGP
jgi:hypothetical protein